MPITAKKDIFDTIDLKILKDYTEPPKVSLSLSSEVRDVIKAEIDALLKQALAELIKGIKPHTIETKTIEKVIEKSIPTPQKIIIKDRLDDIELQKKIDAKIKKSMDESGPLFIPAPPIIPSTSSQDGKFLSNRAGQLIWDTVTATGGGSSPDAYTPTNVTTRTSFDADDTSLDEIADALGSLIASLQGAGIIQ
jgi:hypothetical protein